MIIGSIEVNIIKMETTDFRRRQTWSPLGNHSKITTKIENHHHSEPKIGVNGSLITTKLKKPHPSKLVGGAQMWNRLVPHPRVVDTNSGGHLRSEESQTHTKPLSPAFQCQEDKSPQLLAAKTSRD